jgi:hypothetical protein
MFATIAKLHGFEASPAERVNLSALFEETNLDGSGSFVTKDNTFLDTSYTVTIYS